MTTKYIIKVNEQYLTETGFSNGIDNAKKFDTEAEALAAISSDGNIYQILTIYI